MITTSVVSIGFQTNTKWLLEHGYTFLHVKNGRTVVVFENSALKHRLHFKLDYNSNTKGKVVYIKPLEA